MWHKKWFFQLVFFFFWDKNSISPFDTSTKFFFSFKLTQHFPLKKEKILTQHKQ